MDPFSFEADDLKDLSQDVAVSFFRKLLWAEASRVGISRHLVDVPDCINVGDGGLDAFIDNAQPSSEEIIPAGNTGFQIKSSDLGPQGCKNELHQKEKPESPLKEEIRRLLESGGTYVLVLFSDITSQKRRLRLGALKEEINNLGYKNAKVRLYTINQILSFLDRFPALIYSFKPDLASALPYESWAKKNDITFPKIFVSDHERNSIISEIRSRLRSDEDTTAVFRIEGLPGQGKTRLVFETMSDDDLRNRTMYVQAEPFKQSQLANRFVLNGNLQAIIVIDDCSISDHDHFVRLLGGSGRRLCLISISNEIGRTPPPTHQITMELLSAEDIKRILSNEMPGLPYNVINRLAYFSGGYPRIATLLAQNYLSNPGASPEDILMVNDTNLINRLVQGSASFDSDKIDKTKKVLTGLSLFGRVGFKGPLSIEAKWVSDRMQISWSDFQQIVKEQKNRGIIQGEYYIYVTPFILAIHLVKEWWDSYGDNFDINEFIGSMPTTQRWSMFDRFSSHLSYASSTQPGKNLLKNMLSPNGVFAEPSFLNSGDGSHFFLKLAEADPESALNFLQQTIGQWSKEQLYRLDAGRSSIVWSLQEIAVYKEHFVSAAKLLLILAEAENQNYANNATGVFVELFMPAPHIGPTEAPPNQRLPVLVEAINSDSVEQQKIVIKAFEAALQTPPFHLILRGEHHGVKTFPKFWSPKDFKEIIDYYGSVWTFLESVLDRSDGEIRYQILDILLKSARGIVIIHESLSKMVLESIEKISKYSWIDKNEILAAVIRILHYERRKLPEDILQEWAGIRDKITGTDFSDLLKRFVEMDFLEDYFQSGAQHSEEWVNSNLDKLARHVMEKPDLLNPEYNWLGTDKARRGYSFGYRLGKIDQNFLLIDRLIDNHRNINSDQLSVYFLGGYFKALYEMDSSLWDKKIGVLSEDPIFKKFLPRLIWHSGMTDKAAKLILLLLKNHHIDISSLYLFRYGSVINVISEPIVIEWINYLYESSSDTAIAIALDFIFLYYVYKKTDKLLPKELTLNLLLHPLFWNNPNKTERNQIPVDEWVEVAQELITLSPKTSQLITDRILEFYGDKRSIAGNKQSGIEKILFETINKDPKVWGKKILQLLGPPIDERAFILKEWLRGERVYGTTAAGPLLSYFDPETIWKWIEEDRETRVLYFATFVPPTLFHSDQRTCLARELLVRYGNNDKVRKTFSSNYNTEFYEGSAVVHYTNKKKYLEDFRAKETDRNVIVWVLEQIGMLDKYIEMAKGQEEEEAVI